jgi:predicted N-formylglutamate amidohydrolase
MPYLQVEFRQDEVAEKAGQIRWARRFADALVQILPAIAAVAWKPSISGI